MPITVNGCTAALPTEIQANTGEEISKCLNKSLGTGYPVDHEGILNNYATEPDM